MIKSLDKVLEMIMNGEISIRKASEEYKYTRDVIKKALVDRFGSDNEQLKQILKTNKADSTALEIPPELLKDVFFQAMNKQITLEQARKILNIQDKETLRDKFLEYAEHSEDPKIRELYKKYMREHEQSYSHINFRLVAIRMIREGSNQTNMAYKLGISPRTVAREFEKFSKDEDLSFYNLVKSYSEANALRREFSTAEKLMQELFLDQYEAEHYSELYGERKTKEQERIELEEFYVREEKRLKAEGLTQKQIAERLETSISSLRRARLNSQKRKVLSQENDENKSIDDD